MIIKDGQYSWWTRPLAVADTLAGDPVTWLSTVERGGKNTVTVINHATCAATRIDLAGPSYPDEHNTGALAVDPLQTSVIVAYSRHNQDQHVRVQHIDRATLTAGTQQQVDMGGNVSYAQLLHSGDTVHLLCRRDQEEWVYRTSVDWGATWAPVQVLVDGSGLGQIYVTTRPDPTNPDVVHVAVTGHPNPGQSTLADVGYCQIDLSTGAVSKVGGGALGNLGDSGGPAIAPSALSAAITPSSSYRVRVFDVGVVAGEPAICYGVWKPSDSSYLPRYKVKRWTGSDWDSGSWSLYTGDVFGHNASAHYHGGGTLADDGSGTMRTSREDGGEWIVEQWAYAGGDWTLDAEVARSDRRLIRPEPARGATRWTHIDCAYHGYVYYYGDVVVSC